MKLLITGAWNVGKEQINAIRDLGHEVFFMPNEWERLPYEAEKIEGVICNGLFLYHPIEMFRKLTYIQLTSAGFDRVPMEYVKEHNIEIYNARGVYSIPMAEFAVTGVLELYKQMRFFAEKQKECKWEKHRGLLELNGKIVVIVGCGSVGTECAKRFKAFGCEVIGVDICSRSDEYYDRMVELNGLVNELPRADVVVLTLPLTDETKHMMNREKLKRLNKTAILVNIARGAVIDTEALIDAIDNFGGAVLDVFEEEPLNGDNPLWMKRNVILTPHNSFVGEENGNRLSNVIMKNLRG